MSLDLPVKALVLQELWAAILDILELSFLGNEYPLLNQGQSPPRPGI